MNIGIDFILRGKSDQFTKNLANIRNDIKDTKKAIGGIGLPTQLIGAGGIYAIVNGFKAAIEQAQDLRKTLEGMGRPVDEATSSVAKLGDTLGKIGNLGTKSIAFLVGGYTQLGGVLGTVINRLTGVSAAQEAVGQAASEGAEKQEAALAKLREKEFNPEAVKSAKEKALRAEEDAGMKLGSPEEQIQKMIDKRKTLEEKIKNLPNNTVSFFETKEQVTKLDDEIKSRTQSMLKAAEDSDREFLDKRREDIRDKFLPSVDQLAEMQTGGFTAVNDPRLIARQIKEKEKFAAEAGGRGDLTNAIKLGTEAQNLRQSLEGSTGGGTALTAETAESALRNALETTNKELEGVREQLKGLIKAQ